MLRLYSGSGSQEIDLQGKAIPDDQWAKYKHLAVKMLNARNAGEAARFLDETPFEVHAGINFFGDEFCVLYASVDFDTYIALGETASSPETNYVTTKIVSTLNELLSVYIRFVAVDLATNDLPSTVQSPVLAISSSTVERALEDAQQLLSSGRGASSAIDRAHTALHGYLIAVAKSAGIEVEPNEKITAIFKRIREGHPKLNYIGPRETELGLVLKAAATIVDSINTVRNNASVAHPNVEVVPEPEAMFLINMIRSMLHYIEMKLKT
ncbi:abortive infection family protein [Paraburkholderia sp. IW21]|uniref:abortive infection family protein n=1 Tax=Paraburkholderia sp. IW21 TaxID=3242488 RepID=UPI00351FED71